MSSSIIAVMTGDWSVESFEAHFVACTYIYCFFITIHKSSFYRASPICSPKCFIIWQFHLGILKWLRLETEWPRKLSPNCSVLHSYTHVTLGHIFFLLAYFKITCISTTVPSEVCNWKKIDGNHDYAHVWNSITTRPRLVTLIASHDFKSRNYPLQILPTQLQNSSDTRKKSLLCTVALA